MSERPAATRRGFGQAARTGLVAAGSGWAAAAASPRRILLRSSWQTVNIGDIAHTPGLLEKHLPDAEVRLWPIPV